MNNEVEEALISAEADDDDIRWAAAILAAEVRRLRDEDPKSHAAALYWMNRAKSVEAKLSRVEALPEKWRDMSLDSTSSLARCADDLEAELRDD